MKTANLPYRTDRKNLMFDAFGKHVVTGDKSMWRLALERTAGAEYPGLTNEQLAARIFERQQVEFKNYFKKVLREIEDCLTIEGLGSIYNNYIDIQDYQPFLEALKLKKEYFKNLI